MSRKFKRFYFAAEIFGKISKIIITFLIDMTTHFV